MNKKFGVSVSQSEGHMHETHSHKTTISSHHGEEMEQEDHKDKKAERKGIFCAFSGSNVVVLGQWELKTACDIIVHQ